MLPNSRYELFKQSELSVTYFLEVNSASGSKY